jgi:hypothetical protein
MVRITLVMLLGAVAAASLSTAPGQNAQLASCLHGRERNPISCGGVKMRYA